MAASKFERWLQSTAAFYGGHCMILFVTMYLLPFFLLFTRFWWTVPVGALWMWYDKETPYRGGRKGGFFVSVPLLKYLNDYYPIRLVKTADIDPEKNHIFAIHPHGIFTTGLFGNFMHAYSPAKDVFPRLNFHSTTAEMNLSLPILRDYSLSWGTCSATKKSLIYLLSDDKKGNVVNLVVGGAEETRYVESGKYKIILNKRKGFIKLALSVGCGLVPVITFGENDIYDIVVFKPGTTLYWIQKTLKKWTGIFWCFPVGPYWFLPFYPKRNPVISVVGKSIELPKIPEPTQEQIDHYHSVYKKELIALFEEQKHKYVKDPQNTHLEIVA